MSVVFSVGLYALAKEHGAKEARLIFRKMLDAPEEPSALPCVRTLMRVRELAEVKLFPDFGGSATAKMRTRAAAAAADAVCDVWVSCDDDVEGSGEVVRDLLEAVAGDAPAVCLAPCLLRGGEVVNVAVADGLATARELPSGGQAIPCIAGGFGLVAVNIAALDAAIKAHPELRFEDDDGATRCALFLELLDASRWWGEDLSFFRRLAPGTRIECLVRGVTVHDGAALDLDTIHERTRMQLVGWPAPAPQVRVDVVEATAEPVPADELPPVLEHERLPETASEPAADEPTSPATPRRKRKTA